MSEHQTLGTALPSVNRSQHGVQNEVGPPIRDLFHIPERYLRSTHLEFDFDDARSLTHYVATPSMVALLCRVIAGIRPGSPSRAWRVTGDYGTGKSSFALVLAHMLRDPTESPLEPIRSAIEQQIGPDAMQSLRMVPVLVTGSREPIVPAIVRALIRAANRICHRRDSTRVAEEWRTQAIAVTASGSTSDLLELLDSFTRIAVQCGYSGVFLVLDELGKFLEYAALYREREDLYALQAIAESAARSGDTPFSVLGLLHQSVPAYAEGLPSTTRQEWEKVAGRYEEITFDQPLAHVAALVSGALNLDGELLPESVAASIERVKAASLRSGWYGASADVTPLYPLHPTVLPPLVRFFARFGQHERSLFSFLLSAEPFGLQSFAQRSADGGTWFRLSDFYDYIRSAFGDRLAGASYRSNWLRIAGTIDRLTDVGPVELGVLKAVAVLNVIDAEHLLANDTVITAALDDDDPSGPVSRALASLKERRLVFNRGSAGGYCLWPSTSVDLEAAFEAAKRAIGPIDTVSPHLTPFLEKGSILARRHYIETGTLRHFEIRYADSTTLAETVDRPTEADGQVVFVLSNSPSERSKIVRGDSIARLAHRPKIVLAVPPCLEGIAGEVLDARCWQWVSDNTPELSQDSYAFAEVARQVESSRRGLLRSVSFLFAFSSVNTAEVEWWHKGERLDLPPRGRLSAMVSDICDRLYHHAPLIRNELLNRRVLSSAASTARLRLIGRMLSAAQDPLLGMDPQKAPPEKSMYLSVLSAGNVHRWEQGSLVLDEPPEDADTLRLRPALTQILTTLEQANGHRVQVSKIFESLQDRPFGIRPGVVPLLLAIELAAHSHEIAVYENGTFQPEFGSHDFMRLVKQPQAFDVQLCRLLGVRAEVFTLLARTFAGAPGIQRGHELLDVVRPLMEFSAQLPEYTRQNTALPEMDREVRDALLAAREPAALLFDTLPRACGYEAFPTDGPMDMNLAASFVSTLEATLSRLGTTYRKMLDRTYKELILALGAGSVLPDRAQVSRRAARVLLASREPKLQTFARCLADASLSDDAWVERVGSFMLSNPPLRWTASDEERALNEIGVLCATFCRVEATAFEGINDDPQTTAVRIGLTGGDGSEAARIVRFRAQDESSVQALAGKVEQVLEGSGELKLAAISRVLWDSLLGDTHDQTDNIHDHGGNVS